MTKVSVIIPIYGVEAFIERCATTLMEQTLCEVEYIFVNDATPDRSIQILEEVIARYPQRREQVHIVHHEENKGLPAARNTGLALAQGEYIFHCDSDDYVELSMLEELYNVANEQGVDIVWCDWYLTFVKSERYMKQPSFDTPLDALKSMLGGGMKYNVWNKLIRRSLYVKNNIYFPSGYGMGEDMTIMMLYAQANTIKYHPSAYYHYMRTNVNALCQTYSMRHLEELKYNVLRIEKFIRNLYGVGLEKEIAFFKLEVKFPFLISNHFKRWERWYPETNQYIMCNKYISLRSRCLQWLAYQKQYWLISLYNYIINKIVYGIVYK